MEWRTFFEENLWASALVLLVIVFSVIVFMFYRMKTQLDKLAVKSPEADVYGKLFGEKWGRIAPFLLFLSLIVLSMVSVIMYIK